MFNYSIESPAGFNKQYINISASKKGITHLVFADEPVDLMPKNSVIEHCILELNAYFEGQLRCFSTPIDLVGTAFQTQVWEELLKIPYGKTLAYEDIALALGSKNYCRAVGLANSKNPISIIVPCHRVIGKNSGLVGYAGGLDIKRWLLVHEMESVGFMSTLCRSSSETLGLCEVQ